jgi:hypothetical protein
VLSLLAVAFSLENAHSVLQFFELLNNSGPVSDLKHELFVFLLELVEEW